jgi:hypothetical protein
VKKEKKSSAAVALARAVRSGLQLRVRFVPCKRLLRCWLC